MIQLLGRLDLRPSARRLPQGVRDRVMVLVDGDPVRGVIACDTWQGWVDLKRRDDCGRVVVLDGKPQVTRRHGVIRAVINRPTVTEVEQLADSGVVIA